MNILLTGGAGFIGSNLAKELVRLKHKVICIDNYSTGSRLNHVDGVEYFDLDTRHISSLRIISPDIIFHLGEYSRVEQSFSDFEKVWDYNVHGTKEVLKYARAHRSKLIYAGSSTKFGDNGSNSSPYAWSKANNTEFVKNYSDWYGLNYAITYFYNAYGPNEIQTGAYATLIAKFKELRRLNEEFQITSPGTQLRNFTHVSDIVSGLVLVGELGVGDGYGIGHPDPYTIIQVAEMFKHPYKLTPEKSGNRMFASVVTDKIRELGWTPKVNLPDYIAEIVGAKV
jgi:UDP-glucose 4-epimerase